MEKKKLFKWFMVVKMPFTIYLLVSLMIVPGIDQVSADVVYGAHRGACLEYEENTLEAFEKALDDSKYKFIEFDITYTKDEKVAVIHQNNIVRLPKKGAVVRELDYVDLQEKFEYHIPQYYEVMDLLAGEIPLDIEIKSTHDFELDKKLVDFVINDCRERGILDEIMISSISAEVVEYIETNNPEIKTGKIHWVTTRSIIPFDFICNDVYETPADYVLLHGYNIHNIESLIDCKPEDKELMIWYFTDEVYIVGGEQNKFWNSCSE